jgi:hypothetical protein
MSRGQSVMLLMPKVSRVGMLCMGARSGCTRMRVSVSESGVSVSVSVSETCRSTDFAEILEAFPFGDWTECFAAVTRDVALKVVKSAPLRRARPVPWARGLPAPPTSPPTSPHPRSDSVSVYMHCAVPHALLVLYYAIHQSSVIHQSRYVRHAPTLPAYRVGQIVQLQRRVMASGQ